MGICRNEEDIYLIKRVLSGDDEAFALLVNFYKENIFRLIYNKIPFKQDVEDLAQEVFLRVFKSLKKFDPEKKFSTWIYTIAHNLCIDYLRKKRLQAVSLDAPIFPQNNGKDIFLEISDLENNPEQIFQRTSEQKNLLQTIELLPEQYRTIIKLRHLNGYTYEEISDKLGLPIGTVKSRIYRARNELRNLLEGGQFSELSKSI